MTERKRNFGSSCKQRKGGNLMKISKKLAREILTGNFDNLPLDELQKACKPTCNP